MAKQTAQSHKIFSRLKHPTVQLALAVVLFIVSVLASRGADMAAWEIDVFTFIYNWPTWLRPFFFVITQFGSVAMLVILLLAYVLRRRFRVVLRLLLTGTLSYLLAGVAKDLWGRIRPHEFLEGIAVLDYVVRGPGFPSGHTALATALGLTVAYHMPKKHRPYVYALIILVGLSRVYLGVHAPLDIVGGYAVGWIAYALFRHVRFYDITFGRRTSKKQPNRPAKRSSTQNRSLK